MPTWGATAWDYAVCARQQACLPAGAGRWLPSRAPLVLCLPRSVVKGYQKVARCMGHSATVHGLDWSTCSSILMSHSNDYELLFWNAKTGKQASWG